MVMVSVVVVSGVVSIVEVNNVVDVGNACACCNVLKDTCLQQSPEEGTVVVNQHFHDGLAL